QLLDVIGQRHARVLEQVFFVVEAVASGTHERTCLRPVPLSGPSPQETCRSRVASGGGGGTEASAGAHRGSARQRVLGGTVACGQGSGNRRDSVCRRDGRAMSR